MKQLTSIPPNYRLMRSDEIPKAGDLYRSKNWTDPGQIGRLTNQHYRAVSYYGNTSFFRRVHKKINFDQLTLVSKKLMEKTPYTVPRIKDSFKQKPKAKKLTIQFPYPKKALLGQAVMRTVQVISLDSKYVTGLEQGEIKDNGKFSWHFKKYKLENIPQLFLHSFK